MHLFHTLIDPLLKYQIQKMAEELRVAVKRKLIKGEYYTRDSDSDND
jgi:hypothetical protein